MPLEPENPMQSHPGSSENHPENLNPPNYNVPPTPPPFQNPPPFNQFGGNFGGQQNLPNATATLILGILSIPACCFYGVFGVVFGIIAIVLANGDIKKYNLNPNQYTVASFKNIKTGKICGIVGISLSVLHVIFWILLIIGLVSYPAMFGNYGRF